MAVKGTLFLAAYYDIRRIVVNYNCKNLQCRSHINRPFLGSRQGIGESKLRFSHVMTTKKILKYVTNFGRDRCNKWITYRLAE